MSLRPFPVVTLYKAWLCGLSFVGIAGSNAAGGMDIGLFWVLCVVCCQVDDSVSGWSLVQRSLVCLSVIVKPQLFRFLSVLTLKTP